MCLAVGCTILFLCIIIALLLMLFYEPFQFWKLETLRYRSDE
jgi:hypothetical protein